MFEWFALVTLRAPIKLFIYPIYDKFHPGMFMVLMIEMEKVFDYV